MRNGVKRRVERNLKKRTLVEQGGEERVNDQAGTGGNGTGGWREGTKRTRDSRRGVEPRDCAHCGRR